MKMMRNISVAVLLISMGFWISGCSKSVSGTYTDDSGKVSLNFKSDGKVDFNVGGSMQSGDYKVDGNKVNVTMSGESHSFDIKDDGSLDAGALGTFKKK